MDAQKTKAAAEASEKLNQLVQVLPARESHIRELLKQVEPATGNNLPNVERDGSVPYGRTLAATDAGLSELVCHRLSTCIHIADRL